MLFLTSAQRQRSDHLYALDCFTRDEETPLGSSVEGSSPAEDGGFLWMIKVRSAHFVQRGSKAVGPM
jgi:hypothetical protein